MAAVVKGTAHLFGIAGTVSTATVLDFSLDSEMANVSTTENESGNVIERRGDDITKTGTITIKYQSGYSIPATWTQITYDSIIYLITKVGQIQKNKEHRQVQLSIMTSEAVTLS